MERLNILLLTDSAELHQQTFKAVSRYYRHNFIFEVTSMEEAGRLLRRLKIDLVIFDLSFFKPENEKLATFPTKLLTLGVYPEAAYSDDIRSAFSIAFPLNSFKTHFSDFLKSLRKGQSYEFQEKESHTRLLA